MNSDTVMLNEFKKLVDETPSTIEAFGRDHREIAVFLGIDVSKGFSGTDISDSFASAINDNIRNDTEQAVMTRTRFSKLLDDLIYRYVLFGEDIAEYLKVIKGITECLKTDVKKLKDFSDELAWKTIVQNAKNYFVYVNRTYAFIPGNLRYDYPKITDMALAAKLLVENGATVEIVDSDLHFSGMENVVSKIEMGIKEIGGITCAKIIFDELVVRGMYNKEYERYFITRTAGIFPAAVPLFPVGFVLNLCAKYPAENPKAITDENYKAIVELSTALTATYGVQPYSFWEVEFHGGDRLIELLQSTALFDSIYTLYQAKPDYVMELCQELFSWTDLNKFKERAGFSLQEYIVVVTILFRVTRNTRGPCRINLAGFDNMIKGIPKKRLSQLLNKVSHTSANSGYTIPSHYKEIDFVKKPLIKTAEDEYVLMDRSWCALGVYEFIFYFCLELAESIYEFAIRMGEAYETFLYKRLTSKGISFSEGKYVDEEGECDLIIECKSVIILIEVKRKVLTSEARSGDDINLILDLAASVFDMQFQLGRTELILRRDGYINLTNRYGESVRVELNGREIERVALSYLDFGAFHDRTIIEQILRGFSTHMFSTTSEDPAIKKRFQKFNAKQQLWNEQLEELVKLDPRFQRRPFFHCWFLNYFHLATLLDDSVDNESFYKNLKSTKHVTSGTFDFFREYFMVITAEKGKKAPL
ncbi:MAG: hypothetical protein WDN75_19380 [Bacteroidota bacterium]